MRRRHFLVAAGGLGLSALSNWDGLALDSLANRTIPVSGTADRKLVPLDQMMMEFMQKHEVPGASLAVSVGAKLVYARGFGYADAANQSIVQPESLFRIASVSKPITAVAIMRLFQEKKVQLQDRVVELLGLDKTADDRWKKVTVLHCLQHTGGWDRDKSFDPISRPQQIADSLKTSTPVAPTDIVRYMLDVPLDFEPGERYAYSNFGYLVLGRIIERLSGASYSDYIKRSILGRLKIKSMQLAKALPQDRPKGEVLYFDQAKRTGPGLYPPNRGELVPLPDGAENVEAFEAHGGWIASAADLVRFASAFHNLEKSVLLDAKTVRTMFQRPDGAAGKREDGSLKDWYCGCGWFVRPVGNQGQLNAWHTGYIAGSEGLMVRRWDGKSWALLFNTAKVGPPSLMDLIDPLIHNAVDSIKKWP